MLNIFCTWHQLIFYFILTLQCRGSDSEERWLIVESHYQTVKYQRSELASCLKASVLDDLGRRFNNQLTSSELSSLHLILSWSWTIFQVKMYTWKVQKMPDVVLRLCCDFLVSTGRISVMPSSSQLFHSQIFLVFASSISFCLSTSCVTCPGTFQCLGQIR